MPAFKLPKRVLKIIETKVGTLFEGVRARLLGNRGTDKILTFGYNKTLSLPGIYEAAIKEEGGLPNLETLDTLVDSSKKYLDALQLKAVNAVVKDIEGHITDPDATAESIESAIKESWENVTSQVTRIVDSETQTTKSVGLLEGISRSNAAMRSRRPCCMFYCQ